MRRWEKVGRKLTWNTIFIAMPSSNFKFAIALAVGFIMGCELTERPGEKALGHGCLGEKCYQAGDSWTYSYRWFSGLAVVPICSSYTKGIRTFTIESKKPIAVDSFEMVVRYNSKDTGSPCGGPWNVTERDSVFSYYESRSGIYTRFEEDWLPGTLREGPLKLSRYFKKISPLDTLRDCEVEGRKYKCLSGKTRNDGITSGNGADFVYVNGVGLFRRTSYSWGHGVISNSDTIQLVSHNGKRFD